MSLFSSSCKRILQITMITFPFIGIIVSALFIAYSSRERERERQAQTLSHLMSAPQRASVVSLSHPFSAGACFLSITCLWLKNSGVSVARAANSQLSCKLDLGILLTRNIMLHSCQSWALAFHPWYKKNESELPNEFYSPTFLHPLNVELVSEKVQWQNQLMAKSFFCFLLLCPKAAMKI